MPQTLRFHLDEHVAGAIAAGLRRRGIDVTTAADAGLLGAEDVAPGLGSPTPRFNSQPCHLAEP
jgi:hypothetical protein